MKNFLRLLEKIHDLLVKNPDIAEIFNVDDDKNSDASYFGHEIFGKINWQRVFACFKETVTYLMDYAYKNDDKNSFEIELNESIYDLQELLRNSNDSLCKQMTDNQHLLLFKTHILLLMFSVTATITKDISSLIAKDLCLNHSSSQKSYFRGHSDEKHKLIPTIFRSYDILKYGNEMNYLTLHELYKQPNLIEKYEKVFKHSIINDEFCAFMQHSCSYSPFLDLTRNHIIALSFATSNHGNLNEYFSKKSAVFEFKFNDDVLLTKSNISDMWVYFVKGRLRYFTEYKKEYLFYCVPSSFDPTICLLNKKTNDRMKYQDGAFLFFQSCVVVNGHVLMPYKIGKIIKYTINPNKKAIINKSSIYQEIVERHREFDFEHLMDPYLYFAEITKK